MNGRHLLELAFSIILLGNVLMHAGAFSQVITDASAFYNGTAKSLEGL